MENSSGPPARDHEAQAYREATEAAEYTRQKSLKNDNQSLREARVSSGIAALAFLKFDFWRGETSQRDLSNDSTSQPSNQPSAKVRFLSELCGVQNWMGVRKKYV